MAKIAKSVTIEQTTDEAITRLALKESRSFSQMLDILVNKGLKIHEKKK